MSAKTTPSPSPDEDGSEHCSVEVRPIEGGYIATHSQQKADGSYEHSEKFHRERPSVGEVLGEARERAKRAPVNHLKGAIAMMKGRRK